MDLRRRPELADLAGRLEEAARRIGAGKGRDSDGGSVAPAPVPPGFPDPASIRAWEHERRARLVVDEVRGAIAALAADPEARSADEGPAVRRVRARLRQLERAALDPQAGDAFCGAFLRIRADARAAAWTDALFRMYRVYADLCGFDLVVHDRAEDGICFEAKGDFAFGTLRHEHGHHRLRRMSPSAVDERIETVEATVEVWPVVDWTLAEPLPLSELRLENLEPDGTGERRMRITHVPSGFSVAARGLLAMQMLRSRLFAASSGEPALVRTYVRHPEPCVTDVRTGYQSRDLDAVLAGELDPFVEAAILAAPHP